MGLKIWAAGACAVLVGVTALRLPRFRAA